MASPKVAQLVPGARAPDFMLHHTPSQTLSLRRFTGQPVILVFYPMAFEPVTEEQLTLYQKYLPDFERFRAQIVGVAAEHVWCNQAFARAAGIDFPLLSDSPPRGRVCRQYGVYREPEELSARALFVVDRDGIVRFAEAYPDLVNPGVDGLLTALEGMDGYARQTTQ
jgi:peroxiredoxin